MWQSLPRSSVRIVVRGPLPGLLRIFPDEIVLVGAQHIVFDQAIEEGWRVWTPPIGNDINSWWVITLEHFRPVQLKEAMGWLYVCHERIAVKIVVYGIRTDALRSFTREKYAQYMVGNWSAHQPCHLSFAGVGDKVVQLLYGATSVEALLHDSGISDVVAEARTMLKERRAQ